MRFQMGWWMIGENGIVGDCCTKGCSSGGTSHFNGESGRFPFFFFFSSLVEVLPAGVVLLLWWGSQKVRECMMGWRK